MKLFAIINDKVITAPIHGWFGAKPAFLSNSLLNFELSYFSHVSSIHIPFQMELATRIELVTYGLRNRCSAKLSYASQ